jgi:transitional endoplasmic reticulum ATPase
MEEPGKTGSPVNKTPYAGTTAKLSPEVDVNDREQTHTNGSAASATQEQSQPDAVTDQDIQLTVVEGFQVGRGVARIDPNIITRLECQPGDIVMITGARTTAAKVVPNALSDRGQLTIQMDSQVRQNSASGLGERVGVHKAKIKTAEKVTLLPLSSGTPIQESDLQYIARYLVGLPVTIGDLLRVGTPGAAPR